MPEPLRWGILGVSELVGRKAVLPALQRSPTAEIVAIGSRSPDRARAEAAHFRALRAGSYDDVLDDPAVEAVYLPLPNALHLPWTMRAAEAGKHVLCEKPLACNADEAREMAAACEKARVTLMEAYMTPFHPRYARTLELARTVGDLRFARAAFTFTADDPTRTNYRFDPKMGGGALLDVGIYCLAPLLAIAGRDPVHVAGNAVLAPEGIDTSFSGWLDFRDGFTATFEASFEAPERQLLEVVGTDSVLTIEDQAFTPGPKNTAVKVGDGTITCEANDPYQAMIEHFAAVVRGEAGPMRTPQDSIRMMALLDRLRGELVHRPG